MKLSDISCDHVFRGRSLEEKRWVIAILHELDHAQAMHPECPKHNVIRAAIIGEETGELIKAALEHEFEKGRFYNMHKEAVQVGAMALRFLVEAGESPKTKAIDETTD